MPIERPEPQSELAESTSADISRPLSEKAYFWMSDLISKSKETVGPDYWSWQRARTGALYGAATGAVIGAATGALLFKPSPAVLIGGAIVGAATGAGGGFAGSLVAKAQK